MIPQSLTLPELQACFRDLEAKIKPLIVGNVDLKSRRIINAGPAVGQFDCVTKFDLKQAVDSLSQQSIEEGKTALNHIKAVQYGLLAARPAASIPNNSTLYFATDTYQFFLSTAGTWVEWIAPALLQFLGATASFPALKRSGVNLQVRLADDSAASDLEVLDEAYDAATWNASNEVPTKNAVRDKIETVTAGETAALVSDAAYGAGWDSVTTIAPSKNAVYDKTETLLSKNGVNFGPGAVASITVVNGQITAIS